MNLRSHKILDILIEAVPDVKLYCQLKDGAAKPGLVLTLQKEHESCPV